MNMTNLYERDEIGLLPLTDEVKEIFYSLTKEGYDGNFRPIIKHSHEELKQLISDNIDVSINKLSKKERQKLKDFISVVLLKRFFLDNGNFDLGYFDTLQKELSDQCLGIIDKVIDMISSSLLDDNSFVSVDEFFDKQGFVDVYALCDSCHKQLVDELERMDSEYSISYSDDKTDENEDVRIRYNLLLKDLEYLESLLESASMLNDEYINNLYESKKKEYSIKSMIKLSDIYAKASILLIDGDIEDVKYICCIFKEMSSNRMWKKILPHKFRKELSRFIKDYIKNGAF